jgi:hypothetical protein
MNFCVARKPDVLRLRFFDRRTAGKVGPQDYPLSARPHRQLSHRLPSPHTFDSTSSRQFTGRVPRAARCGFACCWRISASARVSAPFWKIGRSMRANRTHKSEAWRSKWRR